MVFGVRCYTVRCDAVRGEEKEEHPAAVVQNEYPTVVRLGKRKVVLMYATTIRNHFQSDVVGAQAPQSPLGKTTKPNYVGRKWKAVPYGPSPKWT